MSKTLEEIAKATGFSVTTVRFVVQGEARERRISAKTQSTIEAYIARCGYQKASLLGGGRREAARCVALVAPNLYTPFYRRLMSGLEDASMASGQFLLSFSTGDDPKRERYVIEGLLARGVEALLLVPTTGDSLRLLKEQPRPPAVFVMDRPDAERLFPCFLPAHYENARQLSAYLRQRQAHTPYFFVAHPDSFKGKAQIQGFLEVFSEEAADAILHAHEDTEAAGYSLMSLLLARDGNAPEAMMLGSAQMLDGALRALSERLGSIPPSLHIALLDEHQALPYLPNPSVSLRIDERQVREHFRSTFAAASAPVDIFPLEATRVERC